MHENDHLKMPAALLSKKGSRRDFLRNTAVTALAGSALATWVGSRDVRHGHGPHRKMSST